MSRSSRYSWTRAGTPQPIERQCDHPSCGQPGAYRAPRSRDELYSYYWFCLDHVRAYNASWDYYAGMSTQEIESALRHDTIWQRPTWPLGTRMAATRRHDPGAAHVGDPFGFFAHGGPAASPHRPPTAEEAAMKVMNLQAPLTVVALKARYKELVKRHHPDANGGSKLAEERFKQIGQAYKTLLNSLNA